MISRILTGTLLSTILSLSFGLASAAGDPRLPSNPVSEDQRSCDAILRLANGRELGTISVNDDVDQKPPDKFANQPGVAQAEETMQPTNGGAFADLAGDGRMLHVMVGTNGAQHNVVEQFFYFDQHWKFAGVDSGAGTDRRLVRLGKRYFVLLLEGSQLLRIERFTRENPQQLVCTPILDERTHLIQSSKPAVCDAIAKGAITYPTFNFPTIADDKYAAEQGVDLGMGANLSINWQTRLVEEATMSTASCDWEGIVIFDRKRSAVDAVLSGAVNSGCGDSVRPFTLAKDTYFDMRSHELVRDSFEDVERTITQFRSGQLATICKFETATIYRRE
jgi:hypothetical protein